jgi:hypothetical protein
VAEVTPTPPNTEVIAPRLAQRALLVVIDGLRYDSAFESGAMPKLASLRARGASGVSMATDITMTGVGVRTLGTGVASGTWGLARYWDLPAVDFDDLFSELHRRGDKVLVVGNPTWARLFRHDITVDDSLARVTHIFHYVNPVYGADMLWVKRAKTRLAEPGWTFAVVHLGGLDNASHLYTPFGRAFYEKAHAIDDDIASILEAAGPETTVVITSDHGSSDTGHHGSGELVARRSPLLMIGPGIEAGARVDANQVDLAPTLAILLGLPRPAPAEGRVLAEALQLTPSDRAQLAAGELSQVQRYARAYAAAHSFAAPTFTDVRELPRWLDRFRDTTRVAPIFWIAVAALLCAWMIARREPPPPTIAVVKLGVLLLLLEAACVWWRLHYRRVTIIVDHVEHTLERAYGPTLAALACVCVATGVLWLRRRRASPVTGWTALAALFTFSIFGDSLTQGAALVCGAIVLLDGEASVRGALVDVALIGLALFSLHAEVLPARWLPPTDVGVLGLLVVGLLQTRTRASVGVLVGAALSVVVVHHLSSPMWPFRALWIAALLLSLAGVATRRASLAIGLALAMTLLDLSRAHHVLGVVALACIAWRAGIGVVRTVGPRAQALRAALLVVALRMAFLALFEGEFSISHIEVWLGYVGNPGQSWLYGGAAVVVKLWLPLVLALVLVTAQLKARADVMLFVLTFFVFRVLHVIWWMTVARHTFYGPFVDVGFLVFLLVFTVEAALLYAIVRSSDPEV